METADLVTFTEENLNAKLHFLCSGYFWIKFAEKGYFQFEAEK